MNAPAVTCIILSAVQQCCSARIVVAAATEHDASVSDAVPAGARKQDEVEDGVLRSERLYIIYILYH